MAKISDFAAQGLSGTAWSYATRSVSNPPLLAAISSASLPRLLSFTLQGLGNTAWAFATRGYSHAPLLEAISSEAIPKLRSSPPPAPAEVLAPVRGLSAAGAAGARALGPLLEAAGTLMERQARRMDGRFPGAQQHDRCDGSASGGPASATPYVMLRRPHLYVLWKPPGWTVTVGNGEDDDLASADTTPGSGSPLQDWVMGQLGSESLVAEDAGAAHGFLHRLDCQTSGAILCARTYHGYFLASLQFAARRVRKEYVCLCHGWLCASPHLFEAPLLVVHAAGGAKCSTLGVGGRPARTELHWVRHFRGPCGTRLSLTAVRLHTGRMHQIRAHLGSAGHPLVADPKYGGRLFPWCRRVFLHAARLELDIGAGPLAARSDLAEDLVQALEVLGASCERARPSLVVLPCDPG